MADEDESAVVEPSEAPDAVPEADPVPEPQPAPAEAPEAAPEATEASAEERPEVPGWPGVKVETPEEHDARRRAEAAAVA